MTSQPVPPAGADSDRALADFVRAERVRFVFIQSAVPIFSPVAARADAALYGAKHEGRNRVLTTPSPSGVPGSQPGTAFGVPFTGPAGNR